MSTIKEIVRKKKSKRIAVRVNESEMEQLQAKANEFTKGDVSKWLRYSGVNHQPDPSEVV